MAESIECRGCGSGGVKRFLSFGKLPLGNAFLREDQLGDEEKFELDLGFCPFCLLVQQTRPPPVSSLARVYRDYHYVPVGASLRNNLASLGQSIVRDFHLGPDSLFVDIGSNDGALLSAVKDRCNVLGIEPAVAISEIARKAGVDTITDFFSEALAKKVISSRGRADAITVTQVLQHIPDVSQFVRDVRGLLKPDGVFVIEGRYFGETARKLSFDTVYHEMQYFFTLTSLGNLLKREGFEPFRAEIVDVYGGSLRVYAKKKENKRLGISRSVLEIMQSEEASGLRRYDAYVAFADSVLRLRKEVHDLVADLRAKGRIAGYGAPSTGTTLLSFCNLGREYLEYIVDDSPLKQGLLTPGTHIPIVSPSRLAEEPPDYLILIAWRLQNEILPKLKDQIGKGMRIVIPLPRAEILE